MSNALKHLKIPIIASILVFILMSTYWWIFDGDSGSDSSSGTTGEPKASLNERPSTSQDFPPSPTVLPSATPESAFSSVEKPLPTPDATLVNGSTTFIETFDGDPESPTVWRSDRWDITIHSRSIEYLYNLPSMMAAHGPNCEPPPKTHPINTYPDAVYQCKDHLMTAINEPGYGVIYLTPNHMVNFSEREAVIRFEISTQRTSYRDWFDLWITPFSDHLQVPLDNDLPDLSGEPRNGIHIRMEYTPSSFNGLIIRDFEVFPIPETRQGWQGYEGFLTPGERHRETFELRIRKGHIKFGMPDYNFYWIDTAIDTLDWDMGVVQFGHHSYNPTKCDNCQPNTWHWDNISIEPATPFSIFHADRRYVDASTPPVVKFQSAAGNNAFLRFSAIGTDIEVSYDDGLTWQKAETQIQKRYEDDKFWSFWMPVPASVERVNFRGEDWWGGKWHVRDISIWSLETR